MKKSFLSLFAIIIFCLSMAGHGQGRYVKFMNEKLGIFHEVIGGDRMPGEHYILFENYTNNNMRVTYKVTVSVVALDKDLRSKKFSYNKTIYIDPKGSYTDGYTEEEIWDYINYLSNGRGSSDVWFRDVCRLTLSDFELINYGVEHKNYETTY